MEQKTTTVDQETQRVYGHGHVRAYTEFKRALCGCIRADIELMSGRCHLGRKRGSVWQEAGRSGGQGGSGRAVTKSTERLVMASVVKSSGTTTVVMTGQSQKPRDHSCGLRCDVQDAQKHWCSVHDG